MTTLTDLQTPIPASWCPGCGNFGIWAAFKNACVSENWNSENTALVAGIGCHGHIVNFVKINSFEGLHGRAIPVATGIKLANPKLNVFVFTGDGDCLAEGGNHFLHSCRRNHDLTIVLHDNAVYGLTTGQTSPKSPLGFKSKSTPFGNLDFPINPVAQAIVSGASFVARGTSSDPKQLTQVLIEANKHPGLSLVDVLQPCFSFNSVYNAAWYRENTYYLDQNYDPQNRELAIKTALIWEEKKIALGVLYKSDRASYESQIPQIKEKTLLEQNLSPVSLTELFKNYY